MYQTRMGTYYFVRPDMSGVIVPRRGIQISNPSIGTKLLVTSNHPDPSYRTEIAAARTVATSVSVPQQIDPIIDVDDRTVSTRRYVALAKVPFAITTVNHEPTQVATGGKAKSRASDLHKSVADLSSTRGVGPIHDVRLSAGASKASCGASRGEGTSGLHPLLFSKTPSPTAL